MNKSPPLESIKPNASKPINVILSALSSKLSELRPFLVSDAYTIRGPASNIKSNITPLMINWSTSAAA